MDLRIHKTLEAIRIQFLTLRKTCPLKKMKVSTLCKQAKINNSTFYRHYTDIFDLSNKLEDELMAKLMNDFDGKGFLFSKPERLINSLLEAIRNHEDEINALFQDRLEVFKKKVETLIKSRHLKESAASVGDIKLSFIIGGAAHVFLSDKYDFDTDTKILASPLHGMSLDSLQ
jgi:AcrR family transcriptional regulator